MPILDEKRQYGNDRRIGERRIDVMERFDVTQKAQHELVVAEMMDARPKKSPTHRQAEEHDESFVCPEVRFML
jgi:hypothetical protein